MSRTSTKYGVRTTIMPTKLTKIEVLEEGSDPGTLLTFYGPGENPEGRSIFVTVVQPYDKALWRWTPEELRRLAIAAQVAADGFVDNMP